MTLPTTQFLGLVWGFSEFGLGAFKRSKAGATSQDRRTLGVLWGVILASTALGFYLAMNAKAWRLPYRYDFYVAGLVCFAAGMILRWWAILWLGRFFTVNVAIAADHQLVDTGPYRWLRHPSYTGSLATILGLALCIGNVASVLVMAGACTWVFLWRIRVEEAALAQALGEPYAAYMKRTKRLIPLVY